MSASFISILRNTVLKDVLPDFLPKQREIQSGAKYEVSIYALDLALIHRIEHVVNFVIDWYKGTGTLNKPTTGQGLSPLHIAVMVGYEEAVRKLVEAGAVLDSQDKAHWTPLHHAALLQSKEMIAILVNAGASEVSRSLTNGTYRDVLNCLDSVEKDPSMPIPLFGEVKGQTLTHAQFKQLTGAVYVHEVYLTQKLMLAEWSFAATAKDVFPKNAIPFKEKYEKQYSNDIDKIPIHQLKKVTQDSSRKALISSPGYGLYAARSFTLGEMIGEYKGLLSDTAIVNEYSIGCPGWKSIDALTHRNDIPHINDGFMNVVLVPGTKIGGLSMRCLFVAAEDIKEEEQFCWNYGFHPLTKLWNPYVELRPTEVRKFIKAYRIEELVECLKNAIMNKTVTFESFVKAEKFRYILQTPAVIFSMILDKTVTPEEGNQLLKRSFEMNCIPSDQKDFSWKNLGNVAQQCLTIKETLSKRKDCLVNKYDDFIKTFPGQIGFLGGFFGIEELNSMLQQIYIPEASDDYIALLFWEKITQIVKKQTDDYKNSIKIE
jgi:hypothetical protein